MAPRIPKQRRQPQAGKRRRAEEEQRKAVVTPSFGPLTGPERKDEEFEAFKAALEEVLDTTASAGSRGSASPRSPRSPRSPGSPRSSRSPSAEGDVEKLMALEEDQGELHDAVMQEVLVAMRWEKRDEKEVKVAVASAEAALKYLVKWNVSLVEAELHEGAGPDEVDAVLSKLNDCIMKHVASLLGEGVDKEALTQCFEASGCKGCKSSAAQFLHHLEDVRRRAGHDAVKAIVKVLFPKKKTWLKSSLRKYVLVTVTVGLAAVACAAAYRSQGFDAREAWAKVQGYVGRVNGDLMKRLQRLWGHGGLAGAARVADAATKTVPDANTYSRWLTGVW